MILLQLKYLQGYYWLMIQSLMVFLSLHGVLLLEQVLVLVVAEECWMVCMVEV